MLNSLQAFVSFSVWIGHKFFNYGNLSWIYRDRLIYLFSFSGGSDCISTIYHIILNIYNDVDHLVLIWFLVLSKLYIGLFEVFCYSMRKTLSLCMWCVLKILLVLREFQQPTVIHRIWHETWFMDKVNNKRNVMSCFWVLTFEQ